MRPRPRLAAAILAATIATPALAQPQTGLFRWQVSRDGLSWSSALTLAAGDSYKIRGVASWTDGPTASLGFAGCTFEQIDLIGALDSSDVFGGASGPDGVPTYTTRIQGVTENWTLQTGTGASAIGLKIDNINPTLRTSMSQLPLVPSGGGVPNPAFHAENPLTMLMFSAVAGVPKTLTISSTWTRLGTPPSNQFTIYTTISGINKKPLQEAVRTDAVVTIIPAPAPMLGALGLLAGLFRRRPCSGARA